MHAFDALVADKFELSPIFVLFGDDSFLKHQSLLGIRNSLVGPGDADLSVMQFDGDATQWKDVRDELSTISLFGSGGPRLVIVKDADKLVSNHRAEIEEYLAKPARNSSLILVVSTWMKTTRLYKLAEKSGLQIECRAPEKARGRSKSVDEDRVVKWIKDWGQQTHQVRLTLDAARQVLDLIGLEFGLLDTSLAKLALFADENGKVESAAVHEIVGGFQTKTTWEMIDAAVAGDAAKALQQLHRLVQAGQVANAIFGQVAWSLRRYAAAAEIFYRSKRERTQLSLAKALEEAGFRNWPIGAIDQAQQSMKQLGRRRIDLIYQWLVETDLELKGSHSSGFRSQYALEKLIFRLAASK
jgi:DNA polymerase-3 subunit delta